MNSKTYYLDDIEQKKLLELDTKNIKEKGDFYYYTTIDTFKKIIDSGCLFATNIKYMNDWQEFNSGYRYIMDRILEQLRKLKDSVDISDKEKLQAIEDYINFFLQDEIKGYRCKVWGNGTEGVYHFGSGNGFFDYCFPHVYNISFTKKRDLLSQWKMYARESGIAIEFDFSKCNKFAQRIKKSDGEFQHVFYEKKYPEKVIYDFTAELDDVLNNLGFESFISNDEVIPDKMIDILKKIPYIKNRYYKVEDEARLIFRPYRTEDEDGNILDESEINYRESNHVLIPYLTIACLNEENQIAWPITSLTVGPGNNQDVVFSSVIFFVENIIKNIYEFSVDEYLNILKKFYCNCVMHVIGKNEVENEQDVEETSLKAINPEVANELEKIFITIREEINDFLQKKINQVYYNGALQHAFLKYKEKIYNYIEDKFNDNGNIDCKMKIQKFENDNYIASNGIIIQKSQAPYIFN